MTGSVPKRAVLFTKGRRVLKFIKTIFAWGEFVATGNTDKIFNDEGFEMKADIKRLPDGKYALITREGLEATYSRARDARRGAERRGFTVTA